MTEQRMEFRLDMPLTDCLDIACGDLPQGSVNIDFLPHSDNKQRHEGDIHLELTPNFIIADAQHLPFRDNTFELVYSSHAIEHVDDPFLMLKEMCRVSKHRVEVICPHRYGHRAKGYDKGVHKSLFTARWFEMAFQKLGCIRIRVHYSRYRYKPSRWFPLVCLPEEIFAKAQVLKHGSF